MPYVTRLNGNASSKSEAFGLITELNALRAELTDIRTKYAFLLSKLDADVGVTDTNYAATAALAAAQFTPI